MLHAYRRWLEDSCEVTTATTAEEALAVIRSQEFDVVLTDNHLPGRSGVWLLEQVRDIAPNTRRLMMSGTSVPKQRGEAELVQSFFAKPLQLDDLSEVVRRPPMGNNPIAAAGVTGQHDNGA